MLGRFVFFASLDLKNINSKALTCFVFWTTVVSSSALGQLSQYSIEKNDVNKILPVLFREVSEKSGYRFFFREEWLAGIQVGSEQVGKPLLEFLDDLLVASNLTYSVREGYMIVFLKDPQQALRRNELLAQASRSRVKIERVEFGEASSIGAGGRKFVVAGRIFDRYSREPLAGATIQVQDIQLATTSAPDGSFSFRVEGGSRVLHFSYVNYEDRVIDLSLFADGFLNVELSEVPAVLEEVVIQAGRDQKSATLGQVEISMRDLKRAPALLGEVDLIKQVQMMPGVATVSEAASGFNVRGGSVDQNLILYDGLPIFNSSHAFGFFSAFNSEAIRDVTFYRGGVPAEFGGRISSVLNIRSKEGDYEKWGAIGGIGIISSNLQINGPIKKGSTSLSASLRTTYSDWALSAIRSNLVDLQNSSVSFFDGSAKITHRFSQNTKIALTAYQSGDRFRLQDDSTYQWRTSLQALQIDHVFNTRLSLSAMLGIGGYSYQVLDDDPVTSFRLRYSIQHPSLKTDLIYLLPRNKISFGVQAIDYRFEPGRLEPNSATSKIIAFEVPRQRAIESAIYISDQWDVSARIQVDAGVRLSSFHSLGPGNVFKYREGAPLETLNVTDTLVYQAGESITSFLKPEPRILFKFQISDNGSLKGGIHRIYQFLHLITNTTAVTPVDIWLPSSPYIKPQSADQFSLGYYRANTVNSIEWFVETYYKRMNNVLDFKDGADLILNQQIETDLLQGTSRAYGVETQFTKVSGRLTGMISYAYARSLRTIKGADALESINDGREFPSNFDQPHSVNLAWKYGISRRYFFTGAFTFHTGRPVTIPITAFSIENINVSSFSDRNSFRVPAYHRLDLALIIEGSHKRKKFWDGTWTVSLYNAYARRNPYAIFFQEVRPGILRPFQLSVIGTVVPSVSYSFKI